MGRLTGLAAEAQKEGAERGWERGDREGEPWTEKLEERGGAVRGKGENPGSSSDASKIRKVENSQIREKWMKTLEQGVEAEMEQAESEPRVGLEKAETHGNAGMSDPAMGRNVVPGRIRGQAQL